MTTAIYLRQSYAPNGDILAVSRQREDVARLCRERGWLDTIEYQDNDFSATNGKTRPKYQRMLTDIRDGKISAVAVWDLDRLYRQPRELEDLIDLADAKGLLLATVTGDADLSTDNGRLYARIKGAVGKSEIERKAARQKRAARQKADSGEPQWKHAFGYVVGEHKPECLPGCKSHHHQLDPVTAPLVKQAYAAILAGSSLNDICRLFNDAGVHGLNGRPWTPTTVSLFLRKPRNAGLRTYNGEIVGKGTWPGLVEESTWRAAQAVLNAPGRAPGRKTVRQHNLTGVLQCGKEGCGGYLSGMQTADKRIAYGCKTCRGVSIRAEHVAPLLYEIVGGRLAMPDAVDLLKAEIHDAVQAEAIRLELETLYAELEKIGIERGQRLLTGQQAKTATDLINTDIAKLERRQQDQERLRVFKDIALGTPKAVDAIRELSPDRFRAVLRVLASITVAPVGKGGRSQPSNGCTPFTTNTASRCGRQPAAGMSGRRALLETLAMKDAPQHISGREAVLQTLALRWPKPRLTSRQKLVETLGNRWV